MALVKLVRPLADWKNKSWFLYFKQPRTENPMDIFLSASSGIVMEASYD